VNPPVEILRVVLADDHAMVRAGIRALLEEILEVVVVGEASDGLDAIDLIRRLEPDIAFLDLAMPRMSGISATEQIAAQCPNVRVIMLSMHRHAVCVTDAFRAGAVGYIVKDAASSELAAALRAVQRGETYVSPSASRSLIERTIHPDRSDGEKLTPRQLQVLRLLAEGQSTKEIGFSLGISSKTVEVHRAQLIERLGIHDVPGLVRYAMRHGIVPPEPYADDI
jgi:DNA-binding NarL/FixJ family response regulator